MRAIGYISHNTLSPQPKNLSPEEQEQIVRDFAQTQGWEMVGMYSDVLTTNSLQGQSKLLEIMEDSADDTFDVVIVARLDRLTRNIRQLSKFLTEVCQENNVTLVSVEEALHTGTESGRLASQIIEIVAKWDTKRISDRTREIIARKRSKGERVGHAPFGFTYKDKMLVAVQEELETVKLIREKRDAGMSYHKIAKYLNDKSISSKRGGIWYAETVKTVFQNSGGGKEIYGKLNLTAKRG